MIVMQNMFFKSGINTPTVIDFLVLSPRASVLTL
jgi:hypothetical protein